MPSHPHAENMRLYAEDAAETDKPWERWEIRWANDESWFSASEHPLWDVDTQYRRKPLECWIILNAKDGEMLDAMPSEERALAYAHGYGLSITRIVHMREVTP